MHVPSALLYLFSSSVIMYTNKQAMTTYGLFPTYLMMSQSVVLLLFLLLFRRDKIELRLTWGVVFLAVLNTSNVFFGLMGSTHMSVAVFTALRRVSIGFTLLGEILYLGQKKSASVLACVGCMMMAVAVVAADDSSASVRGYTLVMMNNVLTAAATIMSKALLDKAVSKETVLVIINTCQVTVAACVSFHHPWEPSAPGLGFMSASACLGALIQFSSTWSVQENGPLTTSVLGSSKNVMMSLLSCMHIIDNDYVFTWINFVALQVTAVVSFMYMIIS